jgi:hypothetical protein
MGTPIAIIVGAALVAAAICITGHWQMQTTNEGGISMVMRLNRWTGTIEICLLDSTTIPRDTIAGTQLACKPK